MRRRVPWLLFLGMGTTLVEVERKFLAPPGLAEKVAGLGGKCLGVKEFTDRYWDDRSWRLTSQDCWLRQRDGAWELKVPASKARRRSGGETTEFLELTELAAIQKTLREMGIVEEGGDLESTLQPFATIATKRQSFEFGSVRVDSDEADFGHSVMEIEVMATRDAVDKARQDIEEAAKQLGAEPLPEKTGGKVDSYIRRFCPELLKRLVEAGVLE
ncbi:THTPA [Symbiodinium natans]|uniref:THTPA protein n=1 Tax=Symbiodinium natans TaxID=878477 RepID=A0A812LFY8_9DINO|nr:THTPA [Symbiodinium natans]